MLQGGRGAAGVWQVVVNRAGVVWKPKDGALGDWNEEQNVKEGLKGKKVVTEKKEVIGGEEEMRSSETLEKASSVECGSLLMGSRSLGRVLLGPY